MKNRFRLFKQYESDSRYRGSLCSQCMIDLLIDPPLMWGAHTWPRAINVSPSLGARRDVTMTRVVSFFFFFFFLPFGGPFPSCSMSLTGHLQLFFLPHNDPYEHNGIQTAAPDHNKVRMPRWTSNSTFPSVCACTRTFCLLPLFIYLFVYSTSFRLWGITRTSGSLLCEITHANGTKTRFCYRKSDSRAITA